MSEAGSLPGGSRSDSPRRNPDAAQTKTGRKRKQRTTFSCAECRRLKLKCDREFPCANCVKRRCAYQCPDGSREPNRNDSSAMQDAMMQRLAALEEMLHAGIGSSNTSDARTVVEHNESSAQSMTTELPAPQPPRFDSTQATDTHPGLPLRQLAVEQLATELDLNLSGSTAHEFAPPIAEYFEPPCRSNEAESVHFNFDPPNHSSPVSSNNMILQIGQRASQISPQSYSYGSLMIGTGGRSRYLGPTAASEWLREQETNTTNHTPVGSRHPSPEGDAPLPGGLAPHFPFDKAAADSSTAHLLRHLPSASESRTLVGLYFRYFAWHHNIVPSSDAFPVVDRVCECASRHRQKPSERVNVDFRELALVYLMLTHGVLHNLEVQLNDPAAGRYLALAKTCLAKSNFMENSTIAGVQAVHLMAHLLLETESGRNGESTWPLWGLNLRLIQAMGLHRDGERWALPAEVNEIRRRVFWESYAADVMQANCFSRPPSIIPGWIDTKMPAYESESDQPPGAKSFSVCKFELALISARILDKAMKVEPPGHETVAQLSSELLQYEQQLPFYLRCRTSLRSLPSLYAGPDAAEKDSPALNKQEFHLTLKQFTLAINICETVLFLHRPYFARGLHENSQDPLRTSYGPSFLAVVERCHVIANLMTALYECYPAVVARYWWPWHHAFTAAVCMGTLVLKAPRNDLTSFATAQIDTTIRVFAKVVAAGVDRQAQNLQWLVRLRNRVQLKLDAIQGKPQGEHERSDGSSGDEDDAGLISWRTRLVQRVAGKVTKTTSPNEGMSMGNARLASQAGQPSTTGSYTSDPDATSIDDIMHQFWGPMITQALPSGDETSSSLNWWDWGSTSLDPGNMERNS